MTTAIIGTGGLGSAIARRLASGGETLRLSSADMESARTLAATIGQASVVAPDNRSALQGAGAVVLALRFSVLKAVIEEIAGSLSNSTAVIVPSNPVGLDAQGNVVRLLPEGNSSGETVAGWLPPGTRFAMAFGTMSADLLEASSNRSPDLAVLFYASDDDQSDEVERLIRTAGFEPMKVGGVRQSSRLEVGGDLHDLVVGPAQARSLIDVG